jgi:hypothetical protein
VEKTAAFLDEVNIRKFLKCMAFMVRIFYNEELRQLERKVTEGLLLELNCFTHETLHKFICKKATQYLESIGGAVPADKLFRYSAKEFTIDLLDEKQSFLEVQIFGLEGVHRAHVKLHESLTVRMKDFRVKNKMPGVAEADQVIVRFLSPPMSPHSNNFTLNLEKFIINGKIGNNKWKFFNNIETNLGILVVKLSLDVFEKIYDFIWMNQFQNPMLQDADDQRAESELAEAFFWKPSEYAKKKKDIGKMKKKHRDEKTGGKEQVTEIPSVFKRLKVGSTKVYLSYNAGIRLLVGSIESEGGGDQFGGLDRDRYVLSLS